MLRPVVSLEPHPVTGDRTSDALQAEQVSRFKRRIVKRFSSLNLLAKKHRLSGTTTESPQRVKSNYLSYFALPGAGAPPSTEVRRPPSVLVDREKAMTSLRDLFTSCLPANIQGPVLNEHWMRVRDCVELFPVSTYCIFEFLALATQFSENSDFEGKLKSFNNLKEYMCSWDVANSIVHAHNTFDTIMDIMTLADEPVIFTARDCFWKDIISEALTYDLSEFNDIFLDKGIIAELSLLQETVLQRVVDLVQKTIKHVVSRGHDVRALDRFLKHIVEKRSILPSSIFLSGVRRTAVNFERGGGFADVYKGEYEGRVVALKVLRIFSIQDQEKMQRDFCKEALLWRNLDHPNVLPFLGICRDQFAPKMALVSHWMKNGSLSEYLRKNRSADCLKFAIGVARGLDYLHNLKPNIIHGDLRADNVLVDENDEPRITDFGLARAIDSQGSQITSSFKGKGATRWQAPELLIASQFGEDLSKVTTKSDVYAFSCVCLEIFSGKIPFADLRDGAAVLEVAVRNRRPAWPGPAAAAKGLTSDVWFIMQLCWKRQPTERPDMSLVANRLEGIETRKKSPTGDPTQAN